FGDYGGKDVTGAPLINRGGENENVASTQSIEHLILRFFTGELNPVTQALLTDARFEFLPQPSLPDNLKRKINSAFLQLGASINQDVKSFEGNETTDAEQPNRTARASICPVINRVRKTAEIDPIIDSKNFPGGHGTARSKQITTVVCLRSNEFCGRAKLAQQFVIPEIGHKILSVCGDAEWDAANRLHKEGGMGGAIGKMNVKMGDTFPLEHLNEEKCVARAQRCLVVRTIFQLVFLHQSCWPAPTPLRLTRQLIQRARLRRVLNF